MIGLVGGNWFDILAEEKSHSIDDWYLVDGCRGRREVDVCSRVAKDSSVTGLGGGWPANLEAAGNSQVGD